MRRTVRRQALGAPAGVVRPGPGISYWTKNYRTSIEASDAEALTRLYPYYDPIDSLPAEGQQWWAEHGADAAQAGREDILTPA